MPLAPCHSRHEIEELPEMYFCAHPRVFAAGSIISAEFCRICNYWRQPAPDNPRPFDAKAALRLTAACRHLGEQTGWRDCPTCRGNVRLKIFACAHPEHVETTRQECRICPDFAPPTDTA
jgi:hypothetical protein